MKKYSNQDIYDLVNKYNLRLWWIAYELKMQDSNFSRMLRKPLSSEKRQQVLQVIKKLANEQEVK